MGRREYKTMINVQNGDCSLRHSSNLSILWITEILNFVGGHNMYWTTWILTLVFSMIWFRKSSMAIEREGGREEGKCLSVSIDIIRSWFICSDSHAEPAVLLFIPRALNNFPWYWRWLYIICRSSSTTPTFSPKWNHITTKLSASRIETWCLKKKL